MNKDLPIGIQTFADLITNNFLYVDKTQYIYDLIRPGKGVYFLSRPRRFGKSLLLSTLESIFQAKRELFEGLWIASSQYEWPEHPVISLDMSNIANSTPEEFRSSLLFHVKKIAASHGLELNDDKQPPSDALGSLIEHLSKTGKVVVLVDEYDKPLLEHIRHPEYALANRELLKQFYGVLKSLDKHIRLIFLTGVTKFSKVSIFSGLNNLEDITMSRLGAEILGYTQEELEHNFSEQIKALAKDYKLSAKQILNKIKHWYNGYRFTEDESYVYNPFSTLVLFKQNKFASYWYETGTPTFLIDMIQTKDLELAMFENLEVSKAAFSSYEIDNINILPLLYQAGYLTLKDYDDTLQFYTLGYPNYEVERAFIDSLLVKYSTSDKVSLDSFILEFVRALKEKDFTTFFSGLNNYLAAIPYELYISSERYYQNLFYLLFMLIGLTLDAEVHTHRGRIDAVIEYETNIFIFEFKLDKTAKEAMQQIKERAYASKYSKSGKTITLIGVNFNSQTRAVDDWLIE